MTDQQQTCPKCGQPVTQPGSGSITQWMFACTCSLTDNIPNQQEVDLCTRCGKRIGAREGSFSQFIFRANLCHCTRPKPKKIRPNPQQFRIEQRLQLLSNLELNFNENDESDEVELNVEHNNFPIERYKPLAELGRGAAGAVHLCRDRLLNKLVAVKSLHQLSADPLVSFQLEAKANSMLAHKNIIKVLDFGVTESGCPFMVMHFVNGISLEQFLATYGPLSESVAARVVAQVCEALNYVHQNEIFHRDLKPSNILLEPKSGSEEIWDVRLIDFGVAAFKKDQEPTIVQGRSLVGTPTYMSPDQLLNRPYDSRSETYSLGCVLFEILTGRPPFMAETVLLLASMHANEPAPTMAEVSGQEFSSEIERIVAKALAKEPSERYQSAQELRADLLAAAEVVERTGAKTEFETVHSEPEAPPLMARIPQGQRTAKWVIVAVVSLFVLVYIGVSLSLWSTFTSQSGSKSTKSTTAFTAVPEEQSSDGQSDITYSVQDTIIDLRGRWHLKDFKKLALKAQWQKLPDLKLNFVNATVEWKGLRALDQTKVTDLTIEDTAISSDDLKYFRHLKELKYLHIVGLDLLGKSSAPLVRLGKLDTIVFDKGQIDAEGWSMIALIRSLTKVSAAETSGWSGKDIRPMCDLALNSVNLQETNLGNGGAECLSTNKTLRSLEVNNCELTDEGLKYLGRITSLQNLTLMSNDISDQGLMYLKNLKNLITLKAQNTKVTQAGVDKLRRLIPQINEDVLNVDKF